MIVLLVPLWGDTDIIGHGLVGIFENIDQAIESVSPQDRVSMAYLYPFPDYASDDHRDSMLSFPGVSIIQQLIISPLIPTASQERNMWGWEKPCGYLYPNTYYIGAIQ